MSLIETRSLGKTYRQGPATIEVLRGCDLTVSTGETVAILGQSGSGKSTLLALLAGLDRPDEGTIALDGQDLSALSEEALASLRSRAIGIVFQQFHLMSHLTAAENVALPLEIAGDPQAASRAASAIAQVGLASRAGHFPRQLSGGEKQRVAIARAMVLEPKLLLADEPSGNLDARTGAQVMDVLFELAERRRMTLILVTHNADLAARCSRRLVLESGKLRGD